MLIPKCTQDTGLTLREDTGLLKPIPGCRLPSQHPGAKSLSASQNKTYESDRVSKNLLGGACATPWARQHSNFVNEA